MKFCLLALLGAVGVFGTPITLSVNINNSAIDFTPGTPNFLTFPDGGANCGALSSCLAGNFPASPVNTTWIIGGTFTYNGTTGAITGGNPGSFSLSAEGGADLVLGTISLTNIVDSTSPSNSADIDGTLTLTSVAFGGAQGAGVQTALGVGKLVVGEQFSLDIPLHNCALTPSGVAPGCIDAAAATNGSATGVILTPILSPEPGSIALLGTGLGILFAMKRRWTGKAS